MKWQDNMIYDIFESFGNRAERANDKSFQSTENKKKRVHETKQTELANRLSNEANEKQNAFLLQKALNEMQHLRKSGISKDSARIAELELRLKADAETRDAKIEESLARYRLENESVIERMLAGHTAGRQEKKYDADAEKKKLRDAYIPPNLRGGLAGFFDEDKTMGLDESEMIEEYRGTTGGNSPSQQLRMMVERINSLDIPKTDPRRQEAEALVLDVWKHLNMSDQGADFKDGGGFLGALNISNKQEVQAKSVYDEVNTLIKQLEIPEEKWKNRVWIQDGY